MGVGLLDMGQERRPLARQVAAAPQESAGGPHLGRIDRGLGQPAAAQQCGNLGGIDLVVFGLAAVDGFHVKGVTQDKGNAFLSAEISRPGPR